MARPHKHPQERRKNRTVRYTDAEWDALAERGEQAGLTPSEFVREASLTTRVTLALGPRRADPALIAELNRLSLQLAALGNLANQVARNVHSDRRIPEEWSLLPDQIRRAQQLAANTLEEVAGRAR